MTEGACSNGNAINDLTCEIGVANLACGVFVPMLKA